MVNMKVEMEGDQGIKGPVYLAILHYSYGDSDIDQYVEAKVCSTETAATEALSRMRRRLERKEKNLDYTIEARIVRTEVRGSASRVSALLYLEGVKEAVENMALAGGEAKEDPTEVDGSPDFSTSSSNYATYNPLDEQRADILGNLGAVSRNPAVAIRLGLRALVYIGDCIRATKGGE